MVKFSRRRYLSLMHSLRIDQRDRSRKNPDANGVPELPPFRLIPKGKRSRSNDPFRDHAAEIMTEAKELGLNGATEFEVAEHFGVTVMTVNNWKRRYPPFAEALRLGKDLADERIEASLYHKAHGYTYRSEEIKVVDGAIVRVPVITHQPPDTTAMIFWLKNRQRDRWRDQQDVKVDGVVNVNVDVRDLAIKMLATIAAGLAAPTIEHQDNEAQAIGIDVEHAGE